MPADDLDSRRLTELAEALHAAPDPSVTAEEIIAYARMQLDADYASITLIRRDGQLETVAPSHAVAVEVDQLQYELDEGICRDSTWTTATLASPDLATDPRWPHWGPKAAALGISSMIAAELTGQHSRRMGSVNLYWSSARTFDNDDLAHAHLFARHAAIALTSSMAVENLNAALDTRKRIGQAQGIVMERYTLSEAQAFEVLRRYSQDNNVKLRHVADQIVATGALPREQPDRNRAELQTDHL